MKGKFMNFKEMSITQNAGMSSYLTIAWAVPYMKNTSDWITEIYSKSQ